MAKYAISYDLYQGDREDYQELYDALERAGAVRATGRAPVTVFVTCYLAIA